MTKLEEIKLPRPKISDAARREIESMAEATEAIGNKEDRVYSEALRFLLREHDRAHADRAWLIAEVERLTELAKTGGAKCTPEHTWAEWLADRNAALDAERAKVAALRPALRALLTEVGLAGFREARDYSWPKVIAGADSALAETEGNP